MPKEIMLRELRKCVKEDKNTAKEELVLVMRCWRAAIGEPERFQMGNEYYKTLKGY